MATTPALPPMAALGWTILPPTGCSVVGRGIAMPMIAVPPSDGGGPPRLRNTTPACESSEWNKVLHRPDKSDHYCIRNWRRTILVP
jgi:hypothetical protein